MQIKNHFLFHDNGAQVSFRATPHKGGKYKPQYLVMHYTAATTAQSSIGWFLNRDAKASAHLLIARDGTITQFAPFNIVTWHAGKKPVERIEWFKPVCHRDRTCKCGPVNEER